MMISENNKLGSKSEPLERALVVGEDPSLRRLTSTILRQQGFIVSEASSMTLAEETFNSAGGSIALLIASLDVRDNEDVLGTVMGLRGHAENLKIILTSASSPDQLDLELMRDAGIAFLSLPYSFARFSQAVSALPHRTDCNPLATVFDTRLPWPGSRALAPI